MIFLTIGDVDPCANFRRFPYGIIRVFRL
jgi:hypothetical protein